MSNKWGNKNFFIALINSLNGIKYVIKNEKNIKIELVFAILAILLSIFLRLDLKEFFIILIVIFLVIFAEFINTAIETIVDMYTEEYNEKAKIAKDVASGAVLLLSVLSVIIGCFIFLPKILVLLGV